MRSTRVNAIRLLILGCLLGGLPPGASWAAVQVLVGPTPIIKGDARAAGDITVMNEKLAFALAVESAVPYGVPRGALIDLAPVVDGRPTRDRVVFADFIPNHWSAWPNTFHHVDIVERGPDRVVIHTSRDWGQAVIDTVYTLSSGSDHIAIETTMRNGGSSPLNGLLSGLTLWPNSGFLFSVPGLQGVAEGQSAAALAHRVVAYDEHWAIALHADYFDHVGDGSMDLYRLNSLAPGASRTFEGWLQVLPSGDLAPVVAAEITRQHLPAGQIHGTVKSVGGASVEEPVVVVEKRGTPYAWALGRQGEYRMTLPQGAYQVYATAKNHSQTAKQAVDITVASDRVMNFTGLKDPGRVRFSATEAADGRPLDARISIEKGQKPLVEYLGRRTFFTELERKGRVDVPIAPGDYTFSVSSGGGFLGREREVTVHVVPGGDTSADVTLTQSFDPPRRGWYSADLHHHADQAEAVTPPADLARSQLAAGLDLLFVSDHDSTVNHQALGEIAERRGIAFIPGMELSPSWGHFNAYPLTPGQALAIDTSVASIDQVLGEARRQGAIVVQVNHPFIPYGYFSSVSAGVAPGGFNPAFDLMEINASAPEDDERVVRTLWGFWNAGHRYYLAAGTDVHDVWNSKSGDVRVFAHLDGPVSAAGFAEALKSGHAYVTHGPLIFPSTVFGEVLKVKPGAAFMLAFDLESITGLKRFDLVCAGDVLATKTFAGSPQEAHVDLPLSTAHATWYAVVVEDVQGRKAYSNPIWVDPVEFPQP